MQWTCQRTYMALILALGLSDALFGRTLEHRKSAGQQDESSIVIQKAIEEAIDQYGKEGGGSDDSPSVPIKEKKSKSKLDELQRDLGGHEKESGRNAKDELSDAMKSTKDTLAQWKAEHNATVEDWHKQYANTISLWKKEQAEFLGRIPMYRANLVRFDTTVKPLDGSFSKQLKTKKDPASYFVSEALAVPIREQGNRGTCASFTAIRAIEILLKQNGESSVLSPQYFYWASRPDCQQKLCSNIGSWAAAGFEFSRNKSLPDIPEESSCEYNGKRIEDNDTQIPLPQSCLENGKVKTVEFVRVKTTEEIIEAIKSDVPVIAAFHLTPNFYRNKGVVGVSQAKDDGETDEHAKGHAVLIVGVSELPKRIRAKEGDTCLIVANSWGLGWGLGGYGCLTESWVKENKLKVDFLAVTKAQI